MSTWRRCTIIYEVRSFATHPRFGWQNLDSDPGTKAVLDCGWGTYPSAWKLSHLSDRTWGSADSERTTNVWSWGRRRRQYFFLNQLLISLSSWASVRRSCQSRTSFHIFLRTIYLVSKHMVICVWETDNLVESLFCSCTTRRFPPTFFPGNPAFPVSLYVLLVDSSTFCIAQMVFPISINMWLMQTKHLNTKVSYSNFHMCDNQATNPSIALGFRNDHWGENRSNSEPKVEDILNTGGPHTNHGKHDKSANPKGGPCRIHEPCTAFQYSSGHLVHTIRIVGRSGLNNC